MGDHELAVVADDDVMELALGSIKIEEGVEDVVLPDEDVVETGDVVVKVEEMDMD
jgi:hypothetical protein